MANSLEIAKFYLDGRKLTTLFLELNTRRLSELTYNDSIKGTPEDKLFLMSEPYLYWSAFDDDEYGKITFLMNQVSKDEWGYLKEQLESPSVMWRGNFTMRDFLKITELGFLFNHRTAGVPDDIIERGMCDFIVGDGTDIVSKISCPERNYKKNLSTLLNDLLGVKCKEVKYMKEAVQLELSDDDAAYIEGVFKRHDTPKSAKEFEDIFLITDDANDKHLKESKVFAKIFNKYKDADLELDF